MYDHDRAVASIAERVKYFHSRQQQFRIYHGSTNSTRQSPYRRDSTVDTSALTHVLKVDQSSKTAIVEPNVPMDSLVAATLPYGLLPPVVMEFPGITAGGGFAGTGGESSSFRYGFFDRIVNSIEMVLATGDVVSVSEKERPDLFHGAASSFGTLGITTLLEIQLREAQPYVELTYFPVTNMTDVVARIDEATANQDVDYVDGILFSKTSGVICVGKLAAEKRPGLPVQKFLSATNPWFYLHAEDVLRKNDKPFTEVVPVTDYLFRYDRGAFWTGTLAYKYFGIPFNWISRWVLDTFMRTRTMYHAMHKSGHSNIYIIQDVAIPFSAADKFLDYVDEDFGIYPLWLCPLLQTEGSPMSPRALNPSSDNHSNMILNFGVWGPGPRGRQAFVDANRKLEKKVYDLGGKKWLYAHAYYTEEEFWSIYDRKEYDSLRDKYHAAYLPNIYDKVRVDVSAKTETSDSPWRTWLSGIYAIFHTIFRTDYLLQEQPQPARREKEE